MSETYWKCTLVSGKGGHALGEDDITIYTKKIDNQFLSAGFIKSEVNQRFTNPDGGPYKVRKASAVELSEDQIEQLKANSKQLI